MINCKLTSVQQWSAFNTHQWIICTSRARIFMAVYVSLISKYKFSQAKRFLVKPNAKFRPTSDRVFQARSQHRRFLGGRKLNVVKQPCSPQLCQEAQVGWGITRLHQGQLPSTFPHLLACHRLRRVTLGPAHAPGQVWRWLCVCMIPRS